MPYSYSAAKITLKVPGAYNVRSFDSDQDLFYCFPNFKATCTINSASIDLIPLIDVSGSYSLWLVAGIQNPAVNISSSTAGDYYWSGESKWNGEDINKARSIPEVPDVTQSYFADHSAIAVDYTASTPVALTVFPNNIGE